MTTLFDRRPRSELKLSEAQTHVTPANLDRVRCAYHEAAHAVTAIACGLRVKSVSIDPPRTLVSVPPRWVDNSEGELVPDPTDLFHREGVAAHVMVGLSGALIDHLFGVPQDEVDRLKVAQLVDSLGLECSEDFPADVLYQNRMQIRTANVLRTHWVAVEAVAGALLEKITLAEHHLWLLVTQHRWQGGEIVLPRLPTQQEQFAWWLHEQPFGRGS